MEMKTHQQYLEENYGGLMNEIIALLKNNSVGENIEILKEVANKLKEASYLRE